MGTPPEQRQGLALPCRVVLVCAEGLPDYKVAEQLGVNQAAVRKWRPRFIARRLEGLSDEPPPGRHPVADAVDGPRPRA